MPLIYTEKEGFDKNFDEGYVGYSVNPFSVSDIVDKMELMMNNYNLIQKNCLTASRKFDWEAISTKFLGIYSSEGSYK